MLYVSRRSRGRRNLRALTEIASRDIEILESRALMTGDVLATVVQDLNNNGVADPAEPGLSGWTVYVDANRNGALDGGESSALTDRAGRATIAGVAANTWDVREILPVGYSPATGFKDFDRVRVRD